MLCQPYFYEHVHAARVWVLSTNFIISGKLGKTIFREDKQGIAKTSGYLIPVI